MQIFYHHLYEYRKGLRRLILFTTGIENLNSVKIRLDSQGVSYLVSNVSNRKVNIFFGDDACISVLKQFHTLILNLLTDEEDFILGIMLGYDLSLQCKRYVNFKQKLRLQEASLCC